MEPQQDSVGLISNKEDAKAQMQVIENSRQEEVKIQSEVSPAPQPATAFQQEIPKVAPQNVNYFDQLNSQPASAFPQEAPKASQPEGKSEFGNLLEDFAPSFSMTQESKSAVNPQPSNFGEGQPGSASAIPQNNAFQNIPPQPSGNPPSNIQPNSATPQPQFAPNAIPAQTAVNTGAIPVQPVNAYPPPPSKAEIPMMGQVNPEMANMNQYQSSQNQYEEKKFIEEVPPQPAMEVINADEPGNELKKEEDSPEKIAAFYNGKDVEEAVEGKRERLPSDYDATETELIEKRTQKDIERRAMLVDKAMEEQKKKKEMQINAEQELKDWIE
jgi:hypothetical protein